MSDDDRNSGGGQGQERPPQPPQSDQREITHTDLSEGSRKQGVFIPPVKKDVPPPPPSDSDE